MKCFEHVDRDAVGVCIACGKARCHDCLVDTGRAVACRGACEHEVRRLTDLRDFSFAQPSLQESRMKWATGAQTRSAIFLLVMGMGMIVWGLIFRPAMAFGMGVGTLFCLYGGFNLFKAKLRTEPQQFRLCTNCGYNISRNTTNRCPECGHVA